ncbi:MAG: hypothetical protein GY854_32960 [Deltaproteobacteria bacterium]|nr:hypothetical protein [Deltaproteobacteria bacterium]
MASGKIKCNDEAIPLVHMISGRVMSDLDNLLNRKGDIQITFYLAINDVLCNQNSKPARAYLRKMHQLLLTKKLTSDQLSVVAFSYLSGTNAMAADLLDHLFAKHGTLEITNYLLRRSVDRIRGKRKLRFLSKLQGDIEITDVAENSSQVLKRLGDSKAHNEEDEKKLESLRGAIVKMILNDHGTHIGFGMGLRCLGETRFDFFTATSLAKYCHENFDGTRRQNNLEVILIDLRRTEKELIKIKNRIHMLEGLVAEQGQVEGRVMDEEYEPWMRKKDGIYYVSSNLDRMSAPWKDSNALRIGWLSINRYKIDIPSVGRREIRDVSYASSEEWGLLVDKLKEITLRVQIPSEESKKRRASNRRKD